MNLKKSFFIIAFITCVALLYVHQQVELVKAGYGARGAEKERDMLLEHNRNLVYNIASLTSVPRLDSVLLAYDTHMRFPEENQVKLFVQVREMQAPEGERRHALDIIPPAYAESLTREPLKR